MKLVLNIKLNTYLEMKYTYFICKSRAFNQMKMAVFLLYAYFVAMGSAYFHSPNAAAMAVPTIPPPDITTSYRSCDRFLTVVRL